MENEKALIIMYTFDDALILYLIWEFGYYDN